MRDSGAVERGRLMADCPLVAHHQRNDHASIWLTRQRRLNPFPQPPASPLDQVANAKYEGIKPLVPVRRFSTCPHSRSLSDFVRTAMPRNQNHTDSHCHAVTSGVPSAASVRLAAHLPPAGCPLTQNRRAKKAQLSTEYQPPHFSPSNAFDCKIKTDTALEMVRQAVDRANQCDLAPFHSGKVHASRTWSASNDAHTTPHNAPHEA